MINEEFVKETDKLITLFKERNLVVENGNVIVAKVKTDKKTKGGLFLSDDHVEIENYHSGFARVLALPNNFGLLPTDPKVKVGDYIFHTHEARYKLHTPSIRELLDYVVDDDLIYAVQDNEIILSKPATAGAA